MMNDILMNLDMLKKKGGYFNVLETNGFFLRLFVLFFLGIFPAYLFI